MKQLSERTSGLAQSDIRAITRLVNGANGINLGQGICDMSIPDPIKRGAQRAIDADESIYTHYAGIRPLREAILEKARAYNRLPVDSADEVMVSVGSTGAFVSAVFALLDPGDEAILFEPFYGYHRGILALTHARSRFVRTVPQRTGTNITWEIDFDGLREAITPRTKLVVLCTPGNPSGKVWTRTELEQLLGILQEHDLYAVTDEIYEYMVYDGRKHVSLGSLPGAYERTITISGFSKTYNMTGWRLGYAVGPESLIGKMGLLNDLFYICAPAPLQHGILEGLEMDPGYFDDLHESYAEKRRLLCETLERCGFEVAWPEGAYYVMAGFEGLASSHPGFADDRTASRTLIEEARVAAVPGNSFFEEPESGRYFLRFCYAKEMDILEAACANLLAAYG